MADLSNGFLRIIRGISANILRCMWFFLCVFVNRKKISLELVEKSDCTVSVGLIHFVRPTEKIIFDWQKELSSFNFFCAMFSSPIAMKKQSKRPLHVNLIELDNLLKQKSRRKPISVLLSFKNKADCNYGINHLNKGVLFNKSRQ